MRSAWASTPISTRSAISRRPRAGRDPDHPLRARRHRRAGPRHGRARRSGKELARFLCPAAQPVRSSSAPPNCGRGTAPQPGAGFYHDPARPRSRNHGAPVATCRLRAGDRTGWKPAKSGSARPQRGGALLDQLHQPLGAVALQYRGEFRAPRRQLADRAAQIHVDDLPGAAGLLLQQVIERDSLAVGLDQPAVDQDAVRVGAAVGTTSKRSPPQSSKRLAYIEIV